MYGFFDDVEELYRNTFGDNSDPALIFNADKTGFKSDPSKIRGIGVKNKPINRDSDGSGRVHIGPGLHIC